MTKPRFVNTINHCQTEAGAALAFGGEEWFEEAFTRFLIHARAGVTDFHHDLPRTLVTTFLMLGPCPENDLTAVGHRVYSS